MSAVRKLTAEQRATCVWQRPKLRLVKLTPVDPEIVSPRVQNIVVALVWAGTLMLFGMRYMGWL
ncbi:hypothetical protein CS053_08265 [Rhodanobacter glycinis]|uniref:Uncharacterized protein n=1 Tax=Rhodanobacter glycinis TaxID=582702 RepID=A0A5B9DZ64_9GAMM|nr:hypothetical protein [Rhodanobacter glycinis]QEE24494.1 hypothetical protein CS053_08265 [Rhodanobacter glycinis]